MGEIDPILNANADEVLRLANDAVVRPGAYSNHQIAAIMGKLHPTTGEDPNASFTKKLRDVRREAFASHDHSKSPSHIEKLSNILANRLSRDMDAQREHGIDGIAAADSRALLMNKILQLASLRRISDSNIEQLKGEYLRFVGSCVGLSTGIITTVAAAIATAGIGVPAAIGYTVAAVSASKALAGLFVTDAHRLAGVERVAERKDVMEVSTDISGGMPYLESQQIIEKRLLELANRLIRIKDGIDRLQFRDEAEWAWYMNQVAGLTQALAEIPETLYRTLVENPMASISILYSLDDIERQLRPLELSLPLDDLPSFRRDEPSAVGKSTGPSDQEIAEVMEWCKGHSGQIMIRPEEKIMLDKATSRSFLPGKKLVDLLERRKADNKELLDLMRVYKAHKKANKPLIGDGIRAEIKEHLDLLVQAANGVISVTNIADLVALDDAIKAGHKFLDLKAGDGSGQTMRAKYSDMADKYLRRGKGIRGPGQFLVAEPDVGALKFGGDGGSVLRPHQVSGVVPPPVSPSISYGEEAEDSGEAGYGWEDPSVSYPYVGHFGGEALAGGGPWLQHTAPWQQAGFGWGPPRI